MGSAALNRRLALHARCRHPLHLRPGRSADRHLGPGRRRLHYQLRRAGPAEGHHRRRDITTSYTDDAAGQLTKATTGGGATTTYGYDADGNRTTATDPDGDTTTTAYDPAGNATSVTDPLGHTIKTFYGAADQVTKVQDPANQATSYGLDSWRLEPFPGKVQWGTGRRTGPRYSRIPSPLGPT
jgi:YD repeat-containing protein